MKNKFRFTLLGKSNSNLSCKSLTEFKVDRLKDRMYNDLKSSVGGFDRFILYYSKKIGNIQTN